MREIQFRVGKDGEVTVAADGFKGPLCKKLTEQIVKALSEGKPFDLAGFEKDTEARVTQA